LLLALLLACARDGVWTLGRDGDPVDNCEGEPPAAVLAPVDAVLAYSNDERWTFTPVGQATWFCLDGELDTFVCSGPDAVQDYTEVGLAAVVRWDDVIEGSWEGTGQWVGTRTVERTCEGEGCAAFAEQDVEFCALEEPITAERRGPLPEG